MAKSNYVYESGDAVDVGSHGDHDFEFSEGTPILDQGSGGFVYVEGSALAGKVFPSSNVLWTGNNNSPVGVDPRYYPPETDAILAWENFDDGIWLYDPADGSYDSKIYGGVYSHSEVDPARNYAWVLDGRYHVELYDVTDSTTSTSVGRTASVSESADIAPDRGRGECYWLRTNNDTIEVAFVDSTPSVTSTVDTGLLQSNMTDEHNGDHGSIAYDEVSETIVIYKNTTVRAFDRSGTELWSHDTGNTTGVSLPRIAAGAGTVAYVDGATGDLTLARVTDGQVQATVSVTTAGTNILYCASISPVNGNVAVALRSEGEIYVYDDSLTELLNISTLTQPMQAVLYDRPDGAQWLFVEEQQDTEYVAMYDGS